MATWTELPLELKHGVLAYVIPPVDDNYIRHNDILWLPNDMKKAGRSFVRDLESCLIVNKAFSKAMQYPLEQYVRDLRAYRDEILEPMYRYLVRTCSYKENIEVRSIEDSMEVMDLSFEQDQRQDYEELIDFTNDRRKYVLRVLQHIRGRVATWHSLPFEVRIRILGFVLPDIRNRLDQVWVGAGGVQLIESPSTVTGLSPVLASRSALNAVLERMSEDFRGVRRQYNGLQFVSKQFSVDAAHAMFEYSTQNLGLPGQPCSELEKDIRSSWTREFERLDSYVCGWYQSLKDYGCLGLDEDEVVDWSVQMWWLKGRPPRYDYSWPF